MLEGIYNFIHNAYSSILVYLRSNSPNSNWIAIKIFDNILFRLRLLRSYLSSKEYLLSCGVILDICTNLLIKIDYPLISIWSSYFDLISFKRKFWINSYLSSTTCSHITCPYEALAYALRMSSIFCWSKRNDSKIEFLPKILQVTFNLNFKYHHILTSRRISMKSNFTH